ncbi:MAG: glycosyltransferase, partial [Acidimicrobiales bacterium]
TTMVLIAVAAHHRRGTAVVWTCHNLAAHESDHPRLEALLRRRFERSVDGVIHLSEESRRLLADTGRLRGVPDDVVPHGRYRPPPTAPPDRVEARLSLGLAADQPVMATVGRIRRYKNVPALVRAFAELDRPAQLVVAGMPIDLATGDEVRRAAEGVAGLRLDDRWLTDDELALRIAASDVVVLPYLEVHNSGVAILALGLGRPAVINPIGSLAGLAEAVGEEWVYPLTEPPSGQVLDDILEWAAKPRSGRPNLDAFDPDVAARRTVEFYRRVIAAKEPAPA